MPSFQQTLSTCLLLQLNLLSTVDVCLVMCTPKQVTYNNRIYFYLVVTNHANNFLHVTWKWYTKQWKINQNTVHNLLSEIFSLDKEVNKKEWKF